MTKRPRPRGRGSVGGDAGVKLARFFLDNAGYVRVPNEARRKDLGPGWYRHYKKGWEVRLLTRTEAELARVRRWLVQADLEPGRPFRKGRRTAQPIYGRDAVARFLSFVDRERRARGGAR